MAWLEAVNYFAWFIFVFIAVVWILVLMQNRGGYTKVARKLGRLPSVSVLIPAYNEEATLGKTIRSVLSIDYPKKLLEIIVINDCSTDRTGDIAGGFGSKVKVLDNKENRGKAYSLNSGIRVAKGELVACLDADSVVERGIIRKMIGYFADANVGAVTPALNVYRTRNLLEKIQHVEYLLNVFLRKTLAMMDAVHVTPGVFTIYRKSILREVGGFDVGNLTEDMEIALKLHKAGYSIENNMEARSYTYCPDKWGSLFRQRIRWYRGAIHNSVKYRGMFFNPKYGNLGVFLLPFNFISVFAIIAIFALMAWNYSASMASLLWKLYLVNFDLLPFMANVNWGFLLANMLSTNLLFAMFGFVLGFYVLYISFRVNNVGMRKRKLQYFIYLAIFPFALMAFWFLALVHEALRVKKKW